MSLMISLRRWTGPEDWRRRLVFWGGAIATGAVAVGFALGTERAIALFEHFRGR
jgi:hypothetical protein